MRAALYDLGVKDTPKTQKTLHEWRLMRDFEEMRETLTRKKHKYIASTNNRIAIQAACDQLADKTGVALDPLDIGSQVKRLAILAAHREPRINPAKSAQS